MMVSVLEPMFIKTNHKWTEEDHDIIRRDYMGTLQSAAQIAENLSRLTGERITTQGVKAQVQRLGVAKQRRVFWTDEEDEKLADLVGEYAPRTIAKKLHRGLSSVINRIKKLGLSRRVRDGWYTKKDVCEILGVDHHKAQSWIDAKWLKASYHYGTKPGQLGGTSWHINERDLRKFILEHSIELTGRNVDLFYVVNILAGDRE